MSKKSISQCKTSLIFRWSGATIPARARFVGETFTSASSCSLTFGLACGHVGSCFSNIGPLLRFLFGSWTGCSFGLFHQWRGSKRKALSHAERHPSILRHVSQHECCHCYGTTAPKEEEECLKDWILKGSVGRLTWGTLAAQSCQSSVNDIIQAQRKKLIDEEGEKS